MKKKSFTPITFRIGVVTWTILKSNNFGSFCKNNSGRHEFFSVEEMNNMIMLSK